MFKRLWRWYFNLVCPPPKKLLTLSTVGYLARPFETLGIVTVTAPVSQLQEERERRIQRAALKKYPDVDAIIGIGMQSSFIMAGTAVKYRES
jgi:hypothetical protein